MSPAAPHLQALDRTSPMPLWAQVLERLRAGIAAGEYATSFPTDRELMATYDVSRHTAREAVRRLGDEGLLTRVRGRGTTMTARSTSAPHGLALAIETGGADEERRVLASERGRNRDAARQLRLRPDATMFHFRRLCLAGDVPLAVVDAWLPNAYAARLLAADLQRVTLYDELARAGIRPTAAIEQVHAELPGAELRRLLRLPSGRAAFVIERHTDVEGRPLEWRLTTMRGDECEFARSWSSTHGVQTTVRRRAH